MSKNDQEQARRFRQSLREMWVVLGLWAAAGLYSIPVSFWLGYGRDPEEITYPLGLGIPDWVWWGVVLPWLICNLATIYICFFFMEDIPLEEEAPVHHDGPADPE